MAILTQKVQAFSLVEVLVAMVITMTVFGLGITVTANVFASNGMERQVGARLALDAFVAETLESGQYKDGVYSSPPFTLKRTVEAHPASADLVKVSFVVKDMEENVLLTEEKWIWQP